jgi:integrase
MKKPEGQSKSMQPVQPKPQGQKRFRFSKEKIEALPTPKDGPAVFYDTDVKGLCLRFQPSGKKLFFVLKKAAGKPYRRSLSTFPNMSVENARKHSLNLLGAVADWVAGDRQEPCPMLRPLPDSDEGPMTFNTAFKMYLKSPGKKTKKVTPENKQKADARRQYIFDHCFKDLADRPIEELTPVVVGAYHEKLEEKHGPVMANRAHEILRATFNHLIRKGLWTHVNPATGATRAPKTERAVILEPEQLKPFLDALDAEKNRDFSEFVALLFSTGVRKTNLYAAEWDEISLSRKTWVIPAEKSKNGKPTTIALRPEAVELFKMRKQKRAEGCRWVFPSKSGSDSGHIEDYKNQFARLKKAAGLTNFTFHDLRRSFVAYLIMGGVPMPIASEAAGHASLASMSPYARFAKGAVSKALDQGTTEIKRAMDEAEAEKKLLTA